MIEAGHDRDGVVQSVASDPDGTAVQVQTGRKEERFPVTGHAELNLNNGTALFRGRISNISDSGCYVQMSVRVGLPASTPIEVVATVNGTTLRLSAETRFSRPKMGIGLRFVRMTNDMRGRLSDLIAMLGAVLLKPRSRRRLESGKTPPSRRE